MADYFYTHSVSAKYIGNPEAIKEVLIITKHMPSCTIAALEELKDYNYKNKITTNTMTNAAIDYCIDLLKLARSEDIEVVDNTNSNKISLKNSFIESIKASAKEAAIDELLCINYGSDIASEIVKFYKDIIL